MRCNNLSRGPCAEPLPPSFVPSDPDGSFDDGSKGQIPMEHLLVPKHNTKPLTRKEYYRSFRDDHGLTQAQAAALLADAAPRTGRRWAGGEIAVPHSVMLLMAVIRAYGIDIDDVEEIGEPFRTLK